MNHAVHNKLVSFIWSIADDCAFYNISKWTLKKLYSRASEQKHIKDGAAIVDTRFKVRYWGDTGEANAAPRWLILRGI
jgi:hypothetical protein